jgi:tripartite-type tricarboxylate transporter receptor subunit TctC
MSVAPELATAVEQGFAELQIAHWAGLHAPAGMSPEIMDKMAVAIDSAMKNPTVTDKLKTMGIEPVGGTRAAFNEFVNAERARLAAIVKAAGMTDD